MGAIDLPKSPNVFHPEKPSAVGSRNSLAQEYRDQQNEVNQLLEEETNKVIHHLTARLPKDVLERLDVMGGLKEKLYNYFNQNYQNMFNRYMVTSEDEMVKKVRNFIDKEETKVLARYTPKEIADLLDAVGGADKFNTGEIEKSMVNMYGHLQGHIQRGVNELETHTNSILRQKTDTGAFVRGENAYSIVKCAFKDNLSKPKTVSDVKLSVNILDSELISPIFHYQVTVEYLIKDLLGKHIVDSIDHAIESVKDERVDQGLEEFSDSEILFSKIGQVESFTDDKIDDPKSKRYSIVAKTIMEKINDLRAEIDPESFDQMNIRENIKKIVDIENIRNRGFNTAINSITSILDTSKMGYQYIENLKNAREVNIREYEDTDVANLPDERYQIKLRYFDNAQLNEDRKAYDVQMKSFETEVQHIWDILEVIYQDSKSSFKVNDFDDLAKKVKPRVQKLIKSKTGEPLYEDIAKVWDEISFIRAGETEVERSNRTYIYEKDRIRQRIILMRNKMKQMYDYLYPIERRVMEDRLSFLEREYYRFEYAINPYHLQPGILLDVDITSIKRKKATLDAMANVLNEFLHGVSKGFQDAAFASFSRRRSTVREDINQSFSSTSDDKPAAENAYLDVLNSDSPASVTEAKPKAIAAPAKRGRKPGKSGAVDAKPGRRGQKAADSGAALKEV
ncbi:cytoplasmic filament protein CfpA [Leadbettera azotonutricia]|uniref:Cytoplasmic filament protein A n=1 Tax=Leadbettera azotonutricia (strain ATCC BAA-888 / DSM 13862 / ZAS-9) TaxID=545695 RepID=F5Y8I2_LEAAZ|nr:cytoplasmic filament protein CfpA [Leadbettera azotonutricia]AEF82391.1 cytoplasmic filament protein A [Leadbettera azotonutricia ZAS-9]